MAFVKQFDFEVLGRGLLVDLNQSASNSNVAFTVDTVVIDGSQYPAAKIDSTAISALEGSVKTLVLIAKPFPSTPTAFAFQDTFTGSGPLSAHTSDTGQTWVVDDPTWGGNDPVLTSGYLSNGESWGFGIVPSYSLPDSCWVEMDMVLVDRTKQQFEMHFRGFFDGGANNTLMFGDQGNDGQNISCQARNEGSITDAPFTLDSPLDTAMHTWRVEITNTSFKVFLDDVQKANITTNIPSNTGKMIFNLWTVGGTDSNRLLEVRAGAL